MGRKDDERRREKRREEGIQTKESQREGYVFFKEA